MSMVFITVVLQELKMTQIEIDKLLRCRKIVDYFLVYYPYVEESYYQCEQYILDELKKEGFSSIQEFKDFNLSSNKLTYQECKPISGFCDLCGEKELKSQPCVIKYGTMACANKTPASPSDDTYHVALSGKSKARECIENGVKVIRLVCPDNHGFYLVVDNIKSFPFDIEWKYPNKPVNANWTKSDFDRSVVKKRGN